jgi:hypothetical protein
MTHTEWLQEELKTAKQQHKRATELHWESLNAEMPDLDAIHEHAEVKSYWAGYFGAMTNALHNIYGMGE